MDPCLFAEIGKLIKAGRWEVIGGWLEQPDCNLPSTESFFRQGLHAQTFFEEEFGAPGKTRIGYNVDSFGHAGGLPQILKKSGLDYYVFMRPMPADRTRVGSHHRQPSNPQFFPVHSLRLPPH